MQKKSRPQARSRINTLQDYEVLYRTQEFGVTENQLCQAMQHVGPSVDSTYACPPA